MSRIRATVPFGRAVAVGALVVVTVALGWSIVRDTKASSGPSAGAAPMAGNSNAAGDGTSRASTRRAAPGTAAPRPTTPPAAPAWRPCAGNADDSLVVVSLSRQRLAMCQRTTVVEQTPVTTGMAGADNATPTGVFHIQGRNRDSLLTQADGRQYPVKYWIPFEAPSFGFHDSPWQTIPYGSSAYRTGGSHGCVHVPPGAITRLFDWVDIGTTVRIDR